MMLSSKSLVRITLKMRMPVSVALLKRSAQVLPLSHYISGGKQGGSITQTCVVVVLYMYKLYYVTLCVYTVDTRPRN